MKTRIEILDGATYLALLPSGKQIYVTINEHKGKPFEVFVRMDNPDTFEWVLGFTVMITRLLRAGEPLADIGKELMEIHSPVTGHHIPGDGKWCPSLIARIGGILLEHSERYGI